MEISTTDKTKAETFYLSLLNKALSSANDKSSLVIGNIFSSGDKEKNKETIRRKINELEHQGVEVFNQLPYLDENLENPPFEYDIKFNTFYKGLIQSGKIIKLYVLPSYKISKGAQKEIIFAKEKGLELEYLD